MRTDEEIIERIKERKPEDFFGWEWTELVSRLDKEVAVAAGVIEDLGHDWKTFPRDRESILKTMLNYMDFAWSKAFDERGLSAGRSLCHYEAWIWLLGDEDYARFQGISDDYDNYGQPHLRRICDHFGWADQFPPEQYPAEHYNQEEE